MQHQLKANYTLKLNKADPEVVHDADIAGRDKVCEDPLLLLRDGAVAQPRAERLQRFGRVVATANERANNKWISKIATSIQHCSKHSAGKFRKQVPMNSPTHLN